MAGQQAREHLGYGNLCAWNGLGNGFGAARDRRTDGSSGWSHRPSAAETTARVPISSWRSGTTASSGKSSARRRSISARSAGSRGDATLRIMRHAATPEAVPRAVVLVEGTSDRLAVEALARRRGRDLGAEGVSVVPIGGAQAIGNFLDRFGPRGLDVRLAGLCDAGEERHYRRALERAGLGTDLTHTDMEALGFYVCVQDLEDELGSFAPSRSSPPSGSFPTRSSSGASCGTGSSATRPCSSTRSISAKCRGRWTASSLTSDPTRGRRAPARPGATRRRPVPGSSSSSRAGR